MKNNRGRYHHVLHACFLHACENTHTYYIHVDEDTYELALIVTTYTMLRLSRSTLKLCLGEIRDTCIFFHKVHTATYLS